MKQETKNKLFAAWAWCDNEDKSTEFMFNFMSDEAGVSEERAIDFVMETFNIERERWYKDNSNWLKDWKITHTI